MSWSFDPVRLVLSRNLVKGGKKKGIDLYYPLFDGLPSDWPMNVQKRGAPGIRIRWKKHYKDTSTRKKIDTYISWNKKVTLVYGNKGRNVKVMPVKTRMPKIKIGGESISVLLLYSWDHTMECKSWILIVKDWFFHDVPKETEGE